jgi:four helix bundle protein
MVKHFRELRVYSEAFDAAMRIFECSKAWPKEERYSLTDQIRRSSRSVCEQIAEAWRKRRYIAHFRSKLTDADSEAAETQSWLEFALRCGYITQAVFDELDGVYVDDTSLGRKTFQRAKRLILKHNPKGLIDLHSWNGVWQECYGNHSPMLTYMPNLPYVDRVWLGEAFNYNTIDPEMWLIDMSGIPLGLTGEMLHTGNPWRGMVFAQTARLGWGGEPRPIWKLWDDFGMEGCEMLGWWDPRCPVACSDPGVHATVYRKPGKALFSLGSWAETEVAVRLQIDWDALGLNPQQVTVSQPAVAGVQDAATYAVDDPIIVAPKKGALLVVEEL